MGMAEVVDGSMIRKAQLLAKRLQAAPSTWERSLPGLLNALRLT